MDGAGTFEDPFEERPDDEALLLDLDGFEGPIDLLLTLAREQKVDLSRIKIVPLVDQYLAFVRKVIHKRLEAAADYLVMAAWLAYLKSRLLLPEPEQVPGEEPTAAELAEALAFQLRRLEAMQDLGAKLMTRPRLGVDVFARGGDDSLPVTLVPIWQVSFYDLLRGYADHKQRTEQGGLRIAATELYSMDEALERLEALIGKLPHWSDLLAMLPDDLKDTLVYRSAVAATFLASLELAKSGRLSLRQTETFGPIYLKSDGLERAPA